MPTNYKKFFSFLIFILFISCSSKKPEGKTAAEVLYKEAQELMSESRYLLATEKLNTLKTQYPYSFYATHAELMQADILFAQENFIEAAAAYLLFRDFHPKHEKIIYVIFRIAESYFKQLPSTFDRDLSGALEAIKYYTEIIEKYSSSEFVAEATKKREECHNMLNDKERYIADFYFKTKKYEASRFRFKRNLEESKSEDLIQYSMYKIVQTSYLLESYEDCVASADEFASKINDTYKDLILDLKKQCQSKIN